MEIVAGVRSISSRVFAIVTVVLILILFIFTVVLLSGLFFVQSVVVPIGRVAGAAGRVTRNGLGTEVRGGCSSRVKVLYSSVGSVTSRVTATSGVGGSFVSAVSRRLQAPLASVGN